MASVDEVGTEEARDFNQLPRSDSRDLARESSDSSVFIKISHAWASIFWYQSSFYGISRTRIVIALGTKRVRGGVFPVGAK